MPDETGPDVGSGPDGAQDAPAAGGLPPAAERALAEAAERRAALDRKAEDAAAPPEQGGRGGLDPVRYDDWEIGGRAVDF